MAVFTPAKAIQMLEWSSTGYPCIAWINSCLLFVGKNYKYITYAPLFHLFKSITLFSFFFAHQFRYARCLDEPSAKAGIISRAVKLIKDTHPHFLVPHVGYMSKVNTDMSPISTLLHATSPSHDTVKAFVVYKIVEAEGGNVASEVADLFPLVMT